VEKEDFGHAHIWRVAYPLVLGGVAQVVINGTDTAFLGRIGEIAMGAAAIAGLYYVTFFMLGLGFGIGTQILVARHEGENNPNEVRNTMQQSLFFLGALAL
jgi:Na+-driven multidrug efflux pump